MDSPETSVESHQTATETRLTLSGDVDVTRVRPLHEAALDALERGMPVTVDCSGLRSLDASVVQVFAALAYGLARAGARVDLVGVSPPVAKVLRQSGLEGWLAWQVRDPQPVEAPA